jgi:hypothetical protein
MRKLFVSLLVASALTPAAALAQDSDFGRVGRSHAERSDSSSDDHPQRAKRAQLSEPAERPARVERVQDSGGADRAVRVERAERPARVERNIQQVQSVEPVKRVRRIDRTQSVEPVQPVRRVESHNDGFVGGIQEVGRQAQTREQNSDGFSGLHDRIVQNGDRTDSHHRWSGDWRHDHRYDWRNYRDRHRTIFRIGHYYDPYGWGYRRFSTGFNLWPSYYGSSFWLNDPWQYRLPPAYGPYRWVRYYDDALLVNIYSGEVVDVVYNFFW